MIGAAGLPAAPTGRHEHMRIGSLEAMVAPALVLAMLFSLLFL